MFSQKRKAIDFVNDFTKALWLSGFSFPIP